MIDLEIKDSPMGAEYKIWQSKVKYSEDIVNIDVSVLCTYLEVFSKPFRFLTFKKMNFVPQAKVPSLFFRVYSESLLKAFPYHKEGSNQRSYWRDYMETPDPVQYYLRDSKDLKDVITYECLEALKTMFFKSAGAVESKDGFNWKDRWKVFWTGNLGNVQVWINQHNELLKTGKMWIDSLTVDDLVIYRKDADIFNLQTFESVKLTIMKYLYYWYLRIVLNVDKYSKVNGKDVYQGDLDKLWLNIYYAVNTLPYLLQVLIYGNPIGKTTGNYYKDLRGYLWYEVHVNYFDELQDVCWVRELSIDYENRDEIAGKLLNPPLAETEAKRRKKLLAWLATAAVSLLSLKS